MPQMKPMMWLLLMMYFLWLMIMYMVKLYYFYFIYKYGSAHNNMVQFSGEGIESELDYKGEWWVTW